MGRPAGVGDTDAATGRGRGKRGIEGGDLPDRLPHGDAAPVDRGHPGTVVVPVIEAAETQDQGGGFPMADLANHAARIIRSLLMFCRAKEKRPETRAGCEFHATGGGDQTGSSSLRHFGERNRRITPRRMMGAAARTSLRCRQSCHGRHADLAWSRATLGKSLQQRIGSVVDSPGQEMLKDLHRLAAEGSRPPGPWV